MPQPRTALVDQALTWMRVQEAPTDAGITATARPSPMRGRVVMRTGQPARRCAVLDLTPTAPLARQLADALSAACDREIGFAGRHETFSTQVAEAAAIVVTCNAVHELVPRIAGWRIASPGLAVIVALEQVNTVELRALIAAGIGDFIVAPFEIGQLRARIDAAITRTAISQTVPQPMPQDWPLLVGSMMPCNESFRQTKSRIVASFERGYIEGLLRRSAGNISQSARMARKNRRAFFELIRKHEIDVSGFREVDAPPASD